MQHTKVIFFNGKRKAYLYNQKILSDVTLQKGNNSVIYFLFALNFVAD